MNIETRRRLNAAIKAVCPIDGFATVGDTVTRIDYQDTATAQQKADAQALLATFDPSAAADAVWEVAQSHAAAKSLVSANDATSVKSKAVTTAVLAEINVLRAALALPVITKAQFRATVIAKIDAGEADG